MNIVKFTPNEPQELTLDRATEPYKLPNGAGSLYTLSDGRTLHLASSQADSLGVLKLGAGESFRICLHDQKRGEIPFWSIWLSPATEKARAAAETSEIEAQLSRSIELVRAGDRAALRPTGTEAARLPEISRKPAIAAMAAGSRKLGGKIPYDAAFRELVQIVTDGLKASGEQWNDEAKQGAISTLFIAAAKAGWLGVWDREDAA